MRILINYKSSGMIEKSIPVINEKLSILRFSSIFDESQFFN